MKMYRERDKQTDRHTETDSNRERKSIEKEIYCITKDRQPDRKRDGEKDRDSDNERKKREKEERERGRCRGEL